MPTTTVEDLRIGERVARGCDWLDERIPAWWLKVELVEVDMANPCGCVLGQLYGGWYYNAPIDMDTAVECGFDTSVVRDDGMSLERWRELVDAQFAAMTDEWTRTILERRYGTSR